MSLTIHYKLDGVGIGREAALKIVRALHAAARKLPFDKVTKVVVDSSPGKDSDRTFGALYPGRLLLSTRPEDDSSADAAEREREPDPEPPRPPMTQAEIDGAAQEMVDQWEEHHARRKAGLEEPGEPEDERPSWSDELAEMTNGGFLDVEPLEAIWFTARAKGSEPLILGLARYPATVRLTIKGQPEIFETGLAGRWHWEGFCKTQYAGMPQSGGPDHFIAVHKAVVALLDQAVALGLKADVHDEGRYWQNRDEAALRAELRHWNALVARIAGKIKDEDGDVSGPILAHPEFEHLEAEGDKAIERWRSRGRTEEAGAADADHRDDDEGEEDNAKHPRKPI